MVLMMRHWRVIDVIDIFKNVLNMYNEIFLSVNDVDDVFKNVFKNVNDALRMFMTRQWHINKNEKKHRKIAYNGKPQF